MSWCPVVPTPKVRRDYGTISKQERAWIACRSLSPPDLKAVLSCCSPQEIGSTVCFDQSLVQALFAAFFAEARSAVCIEDDQGLSTHVIRSLFSLPETVDDPAPILCGNEADLSVVTKQFSEQVETLGKRTEAEPSCCSTRCPSVDRMHVVALGDGTVLMTVEEAKRRYAECLQLIAEACGGFESAHFKTTMDCMSHNFRPGAEIVYELPLHPIVLAVAKDMPHVGAMIRAAAADTQSDWTIDNRHHVVPGSGFGLQFLQRAEVPAAAGSQAIHHLPILAARSGSVAALQALLDVGVQFRKVGQTVVHEACKYSQIDVIRFGINVLRITFSNTLKLKGKFPVSQALWAKGYEAFEYFIKNRAGSINMVSNWNELIKTAMDSRPYALITMVKAGVRHWATSGVFYSGTRLLLGAIEHKAGFDTALDMLVQYHWTRRCIGEVLHRRTKGPFSPTKYHAWPLPGRLDYCRWHQHHFNRATRVGRRNMRAVISLLERGWVDPSALGPKQSQIPSLDLVQAAARHGHAPDDRDIQYVLQQRLSSLYEARPWIEFYRVFCQFGDVQSTLNGLLVQDCGDVSAPLVPAIPCLIQALVLKQRGGASTMRASVCVLNDLVHEHKASALSFQATGNQVMKCAQIFGLRFFVTRMPQPTRKVSALALALLWNNPLAAAFFLARGATLDPELDKWTGAEVASYLKHPGEDGYVRSKHHKVMLKLLVKGDSNRLRKYLLGDHGLLNTLKSVMGGSLQRQLAVANWRRAGQMQVAMKQAWVFARNGNLRALQKSALVGAEAGALVGKRPMSVASGEAAARQQSSASSSGSSSGGGVRVGTYRSEGCTVLMAGAASGNIGVLHLLLSIGVNPLETSEDGATAADWAERAGASDCVALLRQAEDMYRRAEAVKREALERKALEEGEIHRLETELARRREVVRMSTEDGDSAEWAPRRTMFETFGASAAAAMHSGPAMVDLPGGAAQAAAAAALQKNVDRLSEIRMYGGVAVCEAAGLPRLRASRAAILKRTAAQAEQRKAQIRTQEELEAKRRKMILSGLSHRAEKAGIPKSALAVPATPLAGPSEPDPALMPSVGRAKRT